MGVPSLFRWFEKKFPGVVRKPDVKTDGCDNLYVDANSIVHNACHPADRAPPEKEDDMLLDIAKYLDYVIKTANPSKLVFIAIDGVAPQAKINQQRARRYRASKEAGQEKEKRQQFLEEARKTGIEHYELLNPSDDWDSNTITPGTPFMAKLDQFLHAMIIRKFDHDPFYAQLQIIFSGSAVPGEGEHKAMDFIRSQRQQPGYVPIKHAFYGPDADLIMLALATHEPDFRIVREDPRDKKDARCTICHEYGHTSRVCATVPHDWTKPKSHSEETWRAPDLIFFDVYLLRVALEPYLKVEAESITNNLDRAIDDFILLVALMGNDFLPALPLPNFEIHEGAINTVVDCWKRAVFAKGGYIVSKGTVRIDRLRQLFKELVPLEGAPPERPDDGYDKRDESAKPKYSMTPEPRAGSITSSNAAKMFMPSQRAKNVNDPNSILALGIEIAGDDPKRIKHSVDESGMDIYEPNDEEHDLGLFYDKRSYYLAKFGDMSNSKDFILRLVKEFVLGLTWVLAYYCHGCPSWSWYYPYYYAPFPSDTGGIAGTVHPPWGTQDRGSAMRPFYQLMSVFPPSSANHVPGPFRKFMTETSSTLRQFYPEEWVEDRNGKKQEWKSILKLPFVVYDVLEATLKGIWEDLSQWNPEERKRNEFGTAKLLVSKHHELFLTLRGLHTDPRRQMDVPRIPANPLFGKVKKDPSYPALLAANLSTLPDAPASSSVYQLPKSVPEFRYWEVLPNQPEVVRNYRLIQRIKKPENRRANRTWKEGMYAGRSAKDVASEILKEKRTGKRTEYHDYFKKIIDSDEEEPQPFTKLDDDFDGVLIPLFKKAVLEDGPTTAGWDDDDDDDDNEEGGGTGPVPDDAEDLRGLATGDSFGTSRSPHPPADTNMRHTPSAFNSTTYREPAFGGSAPRAPPAEPAVNASGYAAFAKPTRLKVESDAEDESDSDEESRKKKRKVGKAKMRDGKFSVKKEGWH